MHQIKITLCCLFLASAVQPSIAQHIEFTEYDLSNGLHVILHENHTAPVVAVSVMYHVGSKNEVAGRTGFAHFFEHLLFEGTTNIGRGDYMKIVTANGGENNANTTQDRTFYYEVFPANQLKLGLWLESERMLHPVINDIGVQTQNEVVKEEKRQRMDNQPYGKLTSALMNRLFPTHPYHWDVIGSMQDLDAAKLPEFKEFFKKYYVPGNAVLSIAGDINIVETKKMISGYFADIPDSSIVRYSKVSEAPITAPVTDTVYDQNIQIPAIAAAYRIPGMDEKESMIMELINTYLSSGGSSRLNKKMVDETKEAIQVGSFNYLLEDYGACIIYALPNNGTKLHVLLKDIDAEILKLQTSLIDPEDLQKVLNQLETASIAGNGRTIGIAETLASGYTFHHKNTGFVNQELKMLRGITREDIKHAAIKYLQPSSRVTLYYLPAKS